MNYRNAQYISDTVIDCEINHPTYGWIPYTLNPSDTDMTVNNTDLLSNMSAKGDVAPYVAPTQDELDVTLAVELRYERDNLLLEVDAVAGNALRWADLDADKQGEWASYRTLLLDVPQQVGFPQSVTWPTKPE
tara:strand:- start:6 stop:404 length:399 start_codon:yes stop_codon:yes gene_type:complete